MGEFWDNNDSRNYRIGFRKSAASPLSTPRIQPVSTVANTLFTNGSSGGSSPVNCQQRTFSAPSSLKCTPVTGAAAPVVSRVSVGGSESSAKRGVAFTATGKPEESESEVEKTPIEKDVETGQKSTSSSPVPIPLIRRHSSPLHQSPASSPVSRAPYFPSPPPSFFNTAPSALKSPTTQRYISRRLSLSNYVAPSASPVDEKKDKEPKSGDEAALATPPSTPPRDTRLKDLPEPAKEPGEVSPQLLSPLVMIGGMPASDVSPPLQPSSSSPRVNNPSAPRVTSPPTIRTSNLTKVGADADDVTGSALPFSPTSRAKFSVNGFGSQFGSLSHLASPPVSRQGSESSTPSSSGKNSPNRKNSPPPSKRKESPVGLELPTLESSFAAEVRRLSPQPTSSPESESQVTTPRPMSPGPVQIPGQSNKVDTADSSYAAFVRQWCFAQSGPPTPGVHSGSSDGSSPPASSSPPHVALPSSSPLMSSSLHGAHGHGFGAGYSSASAHVGPKRQQAWPGDYVGGGNGYGFPGFGFGEHMQKGQQVVGGELYSAFDSVVDATAVPGYARRIVV
jgi:hypothetical protein